MFWAKSTTRDIFERKKTQKQTKNYRTYNQRVRKIITATWYLPVDRQGQRIQGMVQDSLQRTGLKYVRRVEITAITFFLNKYGNKGKN